MAKTHTRAQHDGGSQETSTRGGRASFWSWAAGGATAGGAYLLRAKERYNARVAEGAKAYKKSSDIAALFAEKDGALDDLEVLAGLRKAAPAKKPNADPLARGKAHDSLEMSELGEPLLSPPMHAGAARPTA